MIARKAGLTNVPWDGYLKYLRPNIRFTKNKQHAFAHGLSKVITIIDVVVCLITPRMLALCW